MNSISITIDTESPWNLSPDRKVPYYLDVNIGWDVPKVQTDGSTTQTSNDLVFGYKGT